MRNVNHDRYEMIASALKNTDATIKSGIPKAEIAELTGIPKPTVYRMFENVKICESFGIMQTTRTRQPLEYYFDVERHLLGNDLTKIATNGQVLMPVGEAYFPPGTHIVAIAAYESALVAIGQLTKPGTEIETFQQIMGPDITFDLLLDQIRYAIQNEKFPNVTLLAMMLGIKNQHERIIP